MDADAFIGICRKFIGSDNYELIEDLVVLLPDVARQQDLFKAMGQPPALRQCQHCKQILKEEDEAFHEAAYHSPYYKP